MKIPQFVLDDFLKPYSLDARYLVSAEINKNTIKGFFSIKQSVYLSHGITSGHLNMVDVLICFNQLAYVGLAEKIRQKSIPEFKEVNYENFRDNKLNGLIYALDNVKFRKPVNSDVFIGEFSIEQIRKRNETYFIKTTYNFENSVTGKVSLAMKLN
jgi:hypothetical protein